MEQLIQGRQEQSQIYISVQIYQEEQGYQIGLSCLKEDRFSKFRFLSSSTNDIAFILSSKMILGEVQSSSV